MYRLPEKIVVYLSVKKDLADGYRAGIVCTHTSTSERTIINRLWGITGDIPDDTQELEGKYYTRHTVDNNKFSFKIVTGEFERWEYTNQYACCLVCHPDIGEFVYEPTKMFYLQLFANANVKNGTILNDDLSFIRYFGDLILVDKKSIN